MKQSNSTPRQPHGDALKVCRLIAAAAVILCPPSVLTGASAQKQHWVGTWGSAPLHPDSRNDERGVRFITQPDIGAPGLTIREVIHVSLGGAMLRVRFSNLDGDGPLLIAKANVAQTLQGASTRPGTDHALSFQGQPSVAVPPGALVVSDPISFPLAALSDLAISLYIPSRSGRVSEHQLASATSYHAAGDQVSRTELDSPKEIKV